MSGPLCSSRDVIEDRGMPMKFLLPSASPFSFSSTSSSPGMTQICAVVSVNGVGEEPRHPRGINEKKVCYSPFTVSMSPACMLFALRALASENDTQSLNLRPSSESLTMVGGQGVILNPDFCIVHASIESAFECTLLPRLDAAEIDSFNDPSLAELEAAYNAAFGSSPLSSVASTPNCSRQNSPAPPTRTHCSASLTSSPASGPSPTFIPPFHLDAHKKESSLGSTTAHARPSSALRPEDQPLEGSCLKRSRQLPTQPNPSAPCDRRSNKKARQTRNNHERRRLKRQAERASNSEAGRATPSEKVDKHVLPSNPISASYEVADIPCASTGFVALHSRKGRVHTLSELVDKMGFTLIRAERGQPPRPILDKNGLVVAVIVGEPNDPSWQAVHREAHELLLNSGERCMFEKGSKKHRRGNFAALNAGISFGTGLQMPGNLTHSTLNKAELEQLMASTPFVRIAGFQSSAFKTWAPNLYEYYGTHLDCTTSEHPHLRRNFKNSVWAAAAFNFGPRTVTAKHRDTENLPFGWCGVTALGDYDYRLGGHIVFWELKLVCEFPPGFTVLLPSAAVSHSNTPIQRHEKRTLFTQYSAGGIFRWVQHGFQKEDAYCKDFTDDDWTRVRAENEAHCKLGAKLFSTLDSLKATSASRAHKTGKGA